MLIPPKGSSDAGGVPLWNAVFCLDGEVVSDGHVDECRHAVVGRS